MLYLIYNCLISVKYSIFTVYNISHQFLLINSGVVIGHEFGHALDRNGIQYGPFGDQGNVWLSKKDHDRFEKSINAMIAKYNGSASVCSRTNSLPYRINGTLVINEALADHVGLKAAFRALQQNDDKTAIEDVRFSMFTKEQIFFLAFANQYCKDKSADWKAEEFTDVHPTGPFRVNIALQNLPEFAETFRCPVGTAMNPIDKVALW